MTLDHNRPRRMLCVLRLTGVGAFLAPQLAAPVLALDVNPQTTYVVRLFAARNLAMTMGLWKSRLPARRLWWQASVVCDVLDVVAAVLALRAGKERSSALTETGASLVAAGLGVAGLLADRGTER